MTRRKSEDPRQKQLPYDWPQFTAALQIAAYRLAPGGTVRELVETLCLETDHRSGFCELSQSEIAAKLRRTVDTVRKLIREAIELGWVHAQPARRGKGQVYRVDRDKILRDASPDSAGAWLPKLSASTPKVSATRQKLSASERAPNKEEIHDHEINEFKSHDHEAAPTFANGWGGADWTESDLRNPAWLARTWQAATAPDGPLRDHASELDGIGFCAAAAQALMDRRQGKITNAPAVFRRAVEERRWSANSKRPLTQKAEQEGCRLWREIQRRGTVQVPAPGPDLVSAAEVHGRLGARSESQPPRPRDQRDARKVARRRQASVLVDLPRIGRVRVRERI